MSAYRDNPLTPQDVPSLAPLDNSHEANQLEAELKALFKLLFEAYIRPHERVVNTAGSPHLGPMSQVESAIKADGLALVRRSTSDDAAMRYVFRSWRARNPKRGLHMLRIYLQMLWPNAWTMKQMWQLKTAPYPTALIDHDGGNHFLTGRVAVEVSGASSDGSDVAMVAPALRSVIPARLMLTVTVGQAFSDGLAMAPVVHTLTSFRSFTGSFV